MSEYKLGCYYHVKVAMSGRWAVAFYGRDIDDNLGWYLPGGETPYLDSAFSEIGPRIPTPYEPWQCVPVKATPGMMEASGMGASIEAKEVWFEMLAAAPNPEDAE